MFRSTVINLSHILRQRTLAVGFRCFHTSLPTTAGHSKWQNIRHIKALNDGRKSILFIKYARQMRLAIQAKGPNPALNTALRSVIEEATKKNMPNSTIQSVLKKAQSSGPIKKFTMEIKVLDQASMMCVLYTDRFTQMKIEMATILRKNYSAFSDVKNQFIEQGYVEAILSANVPKEELESVCTEHAIEVGAEDVEIMDEGSKLVRFLCDPTHIDKVKNKVENLGYSIEHSEHAFFPKSTVKLSPDAMDAYERLKEKLKAIDGVEDIYDNVEVVY